MQPARAVEERQFYVVWIILQVIHSFLCGVSSSLGGILLGFLLCPCGQLHGSLMVGWSEWFVCVVI
jgi:hypothetical protein